MVGMTKTATPTANCLRCGRKLTAKRSIADRYGRTCRARVKAAAQRIALADYKPFQIDKAREAIEQGAVIPTTRPNVFRLASSDGTTSYLTAPQACTCPAGLKARRCYHRAAATILSTAA